MKKHTRIYLDAMGYSVADFIPCEVCYSKAVDIHHIDCKKMGGDPTGSKDDIKNLMALCRVRFDGSEGCHGRFGDKKQFKKMLTDIHESFMINGNKH